MPRTSSLAERFRLHSCCGYLYNKNSCPDLLSSRIMHSTAVDIKHILCFTITMHHIIYRSTSSTLKQHSQYKLPPLSQTLYPDPETVLLIHKGPYATEGGSVISVVPVEASLNRATYTTKRKTSTIFRSPAPASKHVGPHVSHDRPCRARTSNRLSYGPRRMLRNLQTEIIGDLASKHAEPEYWNLALFLPLPDKPINAFWVR